MAMKKPVSAFCCCVGFMMLLFSFPQTALAHRVNVFAWIEGNTVFVTGKFSGGKRVHEGRVLVKDMSDRLLLEGVTNDRGEFSFDVIPQTDLRIILEAGAGHRGEWLLQAADAPGPAADAPAASPAAGQTATPPAGVQSDPEPGLTREAVRQIVEEALERRLRPIERNIGHLLEPGNRPDLSDILGGIGYIIGLVGLAAYLNSRKRKHTTP
jgi:nickel transport protein